MLVVALYSGLLSEAERQALSPLILALFAALTLVVPMIGVWVLLKLQLEVQWLKGKLNDNGRKMDALNRTHGTRATDEPELAPVIVPELPSADVDRQDGAPERNHPQRRRLNPPGEVQDDEDDEPPGDALAKRRGAI